MYLYLYIRFLCYGGNSGQINVGLVTGSCPNLQVMMMMMTMIMMMLMLMLMMMMLIMMMMMMMIPHLQVLTLSGNSVVSGPGWPDTNTPLLPSLKGEMMMSII